MKDWPVKTLGEVCEVVNGATPDTKVKEYWDGPHAWITPAEMGGMASPFLKSSRRTLSEAGLSSCSASLVPPMSVILSSRAPIGHLIINQVPMATNQGCKSLIPTQSLDFKFLFYYLKANVELLESLGTGTTFKELSGTKLKAVEMPVPPLEEQKRIVALLDAATTRVTELTECYEKARTHAVNLYESACRTEFENQYSKSPIVTLPDISKNLDGRRKPITKADRVAGDIPYYGASGIVDYVKGHIFDERTLLISEDGANLLARSTPIAFIAEGKYWVNNHAHVVKFEEIVTETYVEIFLNSIPIDNWVTGAAQPKLTQAALNRIPIPLPPLEEQKRIVELLDSMRRKTAAMDSMYEAKLQAAKDLRQSILEAAFRGEL